LFQLLRLLLDICGQDGQQVIVLLILLVKRFFDGFADYIHFLGLQGRLNLKLGHKLLVLLFEELFLGLREHEIKLFAALSIHQRVDKQVDEVDVSQLLHKQVDVLEELSRINVINQVDVQLVLTQQPERPSVLPVLHHLDNSFEQNNARLNSLQVTPRHLQQHLEPVIEHEARTALHRPHIKAAPILERGQFGNLLRRVKRDCGSWQGSVQIVDEEFVHEAGGRVDEGQEVLGEEEGGALVGEKLPVQE